MKQTTELPTLRTEAWVLLIPVVLFLIGAFTARYFRQMPIPATPLEQLTAIAEDRLGWTAQAVIFPVALLATAVIFGMITMQLPDPWPRWLGIGATLLFAAGALLWLPISLDRLRLAGQAAEMLRTFDPAAPVEVFRNSHTFWPHTVCILAAIGLMGGALGLSGVLPTLGWIVVGLAVVGGGAGILVMRDWPPFFSYVFLLVMTIGLLRK